MPFIGNVHHFASLKPFLKFTEWRNTYGDVAGLKAGPSNIIVLSSADVCRELLEKRGAIYSGRPYGYIEREHIIRGSQYLVFIPFDGYHKRCRAALRSLLGPTAASENISLQDAAAAFLMRNLALTPEKFHDHLHNWGIGVPLTAICGHRGAQKDEKLIEGFYENQKTWLELLTPGLAPPVDLFPILKYTSKFLAKWKRDAWEVPKKQRAWFYMMLDTVKEELKKVSTKLDGKSSSFEPLMVTLLRQQADKGGFDDDQLAYLCGTVFDAAVDTTYSSALTFIKVLGAYPDILKQAQAEVDNVCGSNRPLGPQDMA